MAAIESVLYRLKDFFEPYFKSDFAEWRRLERYILLDQVKPKTIVKQAGEKEYFLRFILEGGAAIEIKEGHKTSCFDLCFENDILTDFESLNSNRPTHIQILSFEPMQLVLVSRPHLFRIYQASPFGAKLRSAIAEQQNKRNYEHNIGFLGKTTAERYLKLLHERPDWLLRSPQHFIASFLGVTTENLSRVRRKLGQG